jgi:3'(2'), 5'-bisphosphate nucleotidase
MAISRLLSNLASLALDAAGEIMRIYDAPLEVREKADASPVTDADEAAERIILAGLAALDPATPVVSEEAAAAGNIPETAERFYLVDPLDGTREFISRNGEFTVNIALVDNGEPVAGVVYAPARARLFVGETGHGSAEAAITPGGSLATVTWRPISTRPAPAAGLTAVASRSHRDEATDAWLADHAITDLVSAGSSLKFCLLAAGEADVYPRFGRTMEWDTAAGHAILKAAGGRVTDTEGAPLTYGKRHRDYDNPGFIAWAR